MKSILITGGCGFIGSNFIRYMIERHPEYKITNLDKLTYAGNLENLKDVVHLPNYRFVKGDICDVALVESLVGECDYLINFAAETHVDRSIDAPIDFIRTNIRGTYVLLEAARRCGVEKFLQISTDEVYGSIDEGEFKETDPLFPSSPYSASKAAADHMVLAYIATHKIPAMITRSSNNFGPYQFPEKVIPLFITNALEDKSLPLYADGSNVRDWIYVLDNCVAIDQVFHKGEVGEIYNVGGGNEVENIDLTKKILSGLGKPESLIKHVKDRPGHDKRYALDCAKLKSLGWQPRYEFDSALRSTAEWYRANKMWWSPLKEGRKEELVGV